MGRGYEPLKTQEKNRCICSNIEKISNVPLAYDFQWSDATTIKWIEQETSDLQTLLSMSRPFRRITIYGNTHEGMKVIDVSLKHFNLDDVRKLMKVIHDHRPDLPMPQNWV